MNFRGINGASEKVVTSIVPASAKLSPLRPDNPAP